MREKKIFLTLAIAILIGTMLFASFEVREAKALGPEPTIYVDSALYRTTLLTSPVIISAVTAVGQTKTIYVKIARAPHETSEPALLTDKTFTWGFTLTYDTSMFKIASLTTDVTDEPATVTTAAQFLRRRMYSYDYDGSISGYPDSWYVSGFYERSFGKGEATPGVLTAGDTLVSPDPTTVALPAEYFDPTYGPYAPDKGRHAGSYYDLPYTENATQAVIQLGGNTVTDPSYCLLAIIKLTSVAIPPVDYKGSAFHLSDVGLLEFDGKTNYFYTSGGTTMDGYYVRMPAIPEFPLGLASIMILAPLIPIVYLWRTRQKRKVT